MLNSNTNWLSRNIHRIKKDWSSVVLPTGMHWRTGWKNPDIPPIPVRAFTNGQSALRMTVHNSISTRVSICIMVSPHWSQESGKVWSLPCHAVLAQALLRAKHQRLWVPGITRSTGGIEQCTTSPLLPHHFEKHWLMRWVHYATAPTLRMPRRP